MLKKILISALIAVSTFGIFSITEAHYGNNYDCRDNYCRGNFYSGNSNYGDCYNGGYCGRNYRGGRGCR